jgi:hypothetical protein
VIKYVYHCNDLHIFLSGQDLQIVSIRDVVTMKAIKSAIVFLILISLSFSLISCSKAESPIEPDSAANVISEAPDSFNAQSESRHVVSAYQVTINPDLKTLSISPLKRTGSFHYELTQDYPDILTITQWGFTPNFWADIKLSHPLPVSGVDVFDPRVIGVFPARTGVSINFPTLDFHANNSVLLKPDGYTKLWDNSSIPGNANPFIAYFKEQPYHQWSSINPIHETKRWEMDIDGFGGVLTFELVVDISTNYPDEPYPYIDNVEEPFQIDLIIGDGLTDEGGSAPVDAIISDWQGEPTIGGVSIEAPDLFNGIVNLNFAEQIDTFVYKFSGTISNDLLASSGEYPVLVSSWDADTGIRAYNLFKANVAHTGGFNLVDVTPEFVSHYHGDLTLTNDYAIVVGCKYHYSDENVLLIYDISNIENPQFVTDVETYNEPMAIAAKDNILYLISKVSSNEYLLEVLDITNPLSPSVVTTVPMDKRITKLKVIDNYLYGMHSRGIKLIDIETPSSAYVMSEILSTAEDFDVIDGYLYILGNWRLKIYEHQNPYQAAYITSVWDRILRGKFCISDGYAYVSDYENDSFHVIDIDPPEDASIVNSFGGVPSGSHAYSTANSIGTRGDYLYFLAVKTYYNEPTGLFVYNISDRENPEYISTLPVLKNHTYALPADITFKNDYLLYTSDEGLRVVDISTPESAEFTSEIVNLGKSLEAYPDEDYLYIASSLGLQILDITTPEEAFVVNTIPSVYAWDVIAKDGYAYLADHELGLRIIDVHPIADAHVINTIEIANGAHDVAINGDYLYVSSGLSIIDISDPENAFEIESMDSFGIVSDFAAANGYVYLTSSDLGLYIVDVDPPESAFIAGCLEMEYFLGVDVFGDYAYVADRTYGFRQINISNPSFPIDMDLISQSRARDVVISDGYLYATEGYMDDGSLTVINISSPGSMTIVDSIYLNYNVASTNVQDNYAYLSEINNEIRIVKLW